MDICWFMLLSFWTGERLLGLIQSKRIPEEKGARVAGCVIFCSFLDAKKPLFDYELVCLVCVYKGNSFRKWRMELEGRKKTNSPQAALCGPIFTGRRDWELAKFFHIISDLIQSTRYPLGHSLTLPLASFRLSPVFGFSFMLLLSFFSHAFSSFPRCPSIWWFSNLSAFGYTMEKKPLPPHTHTHTHTHTHIVPDKQKAGASPKGAGRFTRKISISGREAFCLNISHFN